MTAVILRDLTTQAEWACACVAVSNFRHDCPSVVGRKHGMVYTLDAPGEPDISMEVWRSQPETLGEDRQDCRPVSLADHSISEGLVEIELMLEKMQSKWHNQQETVK